MWRCIFNSYPSIMMLFSSTVLNSGKDWKYIQCDRLRV